MSLIVFFMANTASSSCTLPLHDALPIYYGLKGDALTTVVEAIAADRKRWVDFMMRFELGLERPDPRSEEHTSELQSRGHLVCRLLLEKKNSRPFYLSFSSSSRLCGTWHL